MKKQEKREWQAKPAKAVRLEVAKREKELLLTKMKLARGQLANVHALRQLRREIAILRTFLREKELKNLEAKVKNG